MLLFSTSPSVSFASCVVSSSSESVRSILNCVCVEMLLVSRFFRLVRCGIGSACISVIVVNVVWCDLSLICRVSVCCMSSVWWSQSMYEFELLYIDLVSSMMDAVILLLLRLSCRVTVDHMRSMSV